MDAKQRVQKMLEQGVIDAAQARRLGESLQDKPASSPGSTTTMRTPLLVIAALLLVFVSGAVWSFNAITDAQETVAKSTADLQSQYQRRYDLIPQLVASIKRFLEHEKTTLESVVEKRQVPATPLVDVLRQLEQATPTPAASELNQANLKAQVHLSHLLGDVMVMAEQYPVLRSADQFLVLQAQIEGAENRINIARLARNRAVSEYNALILKIPHRWLANPLGFAHLDHFEAAEGAERRPGQTW